MSAALVLAHPSHWAVQLAYLAPLGLLVVILLADRIKRRRRGESDPQRLD